MDEQSREKNNQAVLLSAGKVATAEGEIEGCEADKAIDGQESTYWAGGPYYIWWKLDLLHCHDISRINIFTGIEEYEYSRYFIECSEDNLNWKTIAEKIDNKVSSDGEQYDVFIAARFIRVTFTYWSSGEVVKLRDFQVYGREMNAEGQITGSKITSSRCAPYKFHAMFYDMSQGFEKTVVNDIERGREDVVIVGGGVGSYVVFRDVNFTELGVNQLRGNFGFTNLDKEKRVTIEVRLDDLQGECIGEMVLFKQWERWSMLAGDLKHTNQTYLAGIHDVYLVVTDAAPDQHLMIHWLAFVKRTPLPLPKLRPLDLPEPSDGEYQIYFGNLHSHTGFSDGIGVPEMAYDFARYEAKLDFLAITEHSNLYDNYLDWDQSRKWKDIQLVAKQKTEDGSFLALFGAETTWYNQFGHMNTYAMDFFINAYETRYNDIARYYETIKQYPDSVHQWNHPWSCGKRHLDRFEPYDAQVDEVLQMIEINPIESEELGGLYYYVMALDKGWHVAPVGNQDNHRGEWGTQNTLRTAILAEKLTKDHFFDAVRRHRVYFTSALHLKVWFKINGAIMGSRIKQCDRLEIEIRAQYGEDTGSHIVKAEVIGEGGQVLHEIDHNGKELNCKFHLLCQQRYYFVKIYQEDGLFAATAPIWMEG